MTQQLNQVQNQLMHLESFEMSQGDLYNLKQETLVNPPTYS